MFERQKARTELSLFNENCHTLHSLTPGLTDRAPGRGPIYLKTFKEMTAELKRLIDDEVTYIIKEAGGKPLDKKTVANINAFVGAIKAVTDRWMGSAPR